MKTNNIAIEICSKLYAFESMPVSVGCLFGLAEAFFAR